MSPTARSMKLMRERGYLVDIVERWIPGANIRKDLFGFIDLLAIEGVEGVVAIQATSASNVSSRISKIADHPNLPAVRAMGWRILVHGWRKNPQGRWVVREVDCS
jgi:hypothetical protein